MALKKTASITSTFIFLISTFFYTNSQEPNELMQIEYSKIEKNKATIIQELKRNAFIKIGLITAVGATMSYGCYKLFFAPTGTPTTVTPVPKIVPQELVPKETSFQNAEILKKLNEIQGEMRNWEGVIQSQKEICEFHGYYQSPLNQWWPWLKSWGKYFGAQYVTIGIAHIVTGTISPFTKYLRMLDRGVDLVIDRVFHNADLSWYLSTHTNFSDLNSQIEKHVDSLMNNEGDVIAFYHKEGIAHSWNLFILQLESTLGFMSCKADMLAKKSIINAARVHNLVKRIITDINQQVSCLQAIINSSSISNETTTELKHKLAGINTLVQDSLHSFAAFEVLTIS